MRVLLFIFGFFFFSQADAARDTNLITPHTTEQPGEFQLIRSDEDYSAFIDPSYRHGFLDEIKYIALNENKTSYLTLGGQVREEYEYFKEENWGLLNIPDQHIISRFMLDADLHFDADRRIFLELKSGFVSLNRYAPGPHDVDYLDFNQFFIDQKWPFKESKSMTLRVGMSELNYGDARLISVREGPNIRLGFLGVKTMNYFGLTRLDTFWVMPVETKRGVFDDHPSIGEQLWSSYLMAHLGALEWEVYYIGYRHDTASFVVGSGYEERHTIGSRLAREQNRYANHIDFDIEALYQFGRFSGLPISAWLVDSDVGYTIANLPWRPRFALKAGATSGDQNQGRGSFGTFNPLFPRGGYLDLSAEIGPSNLINFNPYINFHPSSKLSITTGYSLLWRESIHDGLYSPNMDILRAPDGSNARFVGAETSITSSYQASRHLNFVAGYAFIPAGEFIQETGPRLTSQYGSIYAYFIF